MAKKENVVLVPVWIGGRTYDNSDLSAFESELSRLRIMRTAIHDLASIELRARYGKRYLMLLRQLCANLKNVFLTSKNPLLLVCILPAFVMDLCWYKPLMRVLARSAKKHGHYFCVIACGGDFEKPAPYIENAFFDQNERTAFELGAIYSFYNGDAPSAGMGRLVELINRMTGVDLPGDEFPGYSFEEIALIAHNINREDFNAFRRRDGAIDKYPIENGRPVFFVPISAVQALPAPNWLCA